jgi:hypothetical protein
LLHQCCWDPMITVILVKNGIKLRSGRLL